MISATMISAFENSGPAPIYLTCAVLLVSIILVTMKMSGQSKLPPGPRGVRILGNAPALGGKDMHRQILRWANEFGGIYTLRVPGQIFVVLSDPALFLPLLGKGGKHLPKSHVYKAAASMMGPTGHESIFSSQHETPFWKTVRKTLAPCFSIENVRRSFPKTLAIAKQLGDMMDGIAAEGQYKASLDITDLVTRATFDIIGETGFHMQFNGLRDYGKPNFFLDNLHAGLTEVSKCLADPTRRIIREIIFSVPGLLSLAPEHAQLHKHLKGIWATYEVMLTELRERGEPAEDDHSMSAALMRLKDPETGGRMKDAAVMANMATFLIGGFDTGASTLSWALYDIACHPAAQAVIRAELEAAHLLLKQGSSAQERAELDYNILHTLPYFNACLKESMRIHPVATTGTFREAEEAISIGEYVIPAKAVVWIPFITNHNSIHNWQDADKFLPERWLECDAHTEAEAADSPSTSPPLVNSDAFIPFSAGHRNCIGMNLAYMTTRTVLLSLLSRFWFEVDESKMGDRQTNEENTVNALVLIPGNGCHLTVTPHA